MINKMKGWPMDQKKIFANHTSISDGKLTYKIHKELTKFNSKKKKNDLKMNKGLE